MAQNNDERELVCTLTAEEQRERAETITTALGPRYNGYEERDDGVSVRFEGTDEVLQRVAEFVSNELACCSFAAYEISVDPPYDETVVTISGPEGTKSLFRDGLARQLESSAN